LYLASLTHVPQMSRRLTEAPLESQQLTQALPSTLQQALPSSAQHVQQALP
jgi:hypothetical protein